ncbi:MAG: hypothetical protein WAK31_20700, partial [Chthoniobacterales bacterium]
RNPGRSRGATPKISKIPLTLNEGTELICVNRSLSRQSGAAADSSAVGVRFLGLFATFRVHSR